MTCSELERILPDVIDDDTEDAECQAHLESCPGCSELVAELRLIASESRELVDAQDPPDRVWVSISNQLRAEGIIRERAPVPARPALVPAPARRWNAWWLAPVAVAILVAGSYRFTHQPGQGQRDQSKLGETGSTAPQVAQQQAAKQAAAQPQPGPSIANTPATEQATKQFSPAASQPAQMAQRSAPPSARSNTEIASSTRNGNAAPTAKGPRIELPRPANPVVEARASELPSTEDERFLSEVSQRAPTMRATYENQLRAVNAEIRETQAYIRRYPNDLDARQHLMDVYQQKAMLYQMALDRIQ